MDSHNIRVRFTAEADFDGWSYSTVGMTLTDPVALATPDGEAAEHRWVAFDEVETLPLHPDLALSWSQLRTAFAGVNA